MALSMSDSSSSRSRPPTTHPYPTPCEPPRRRFSSLQLRRSLADSERRTTPVASISILQACRSACPTLGFVQCLFCGLPRPICNCRTASKNPRVASYSNRRFTGQPDNIELSSVSSSRSISLSSISGSLSAEDSPTARSVRRSRDGEISVVNMEQPAQPSRGSTSHLRSPRLHHSPANAATGLADAVSCKVDARTDKGNTLPHAVVGNLEREVGLLEKEQTHLSATISKLNLERKVLDEELDTARMENAQLRIEVGERQVAIPQAEILHTPICFGGPSSRIQDCLISCLKKDAESNESAQETQRHHTSKILEAHHEMRLESDRYQELQTQLDRSEAENQSLKSQVQMLNEELCTKALAASHETEAMVSRLEASQLLVQEAEERQMDFSKLVAACSYARERDKQEFELTMNKLSQQLDTVQHERNSLEAQFQQLTKHVHTLCSENEDLTAHLQTTKQELLSTKEQLSDHKAVVQRQQQELKKARKKLEMAEERVRKAMQERAEAVQKLQKTQSLADTRDIEKKEAAHAHIQQMVAMEQVHQDMLAALKLDLVVARQAGACAEEHLEAEMHAKQRTQLQLEECWGRLTIHTDWAMATLDPAMEAIRQEAEKLRWHSDASATTLSDLERECNGLRADINRLKVAKTASDEEGKICAAELQQSQQQLEALKCALDAQVKAVQALVSGQLTDTVQRRDFSCCCGSPNCPQVSIFLTLVHENQMLRKRWACSVCHQQSPPDRFVEAEVSSHSPASASGL